MSHITRRTDQVRELQRRRRLAIHLLITTPPIEARCPRCNQIEARIPIINPKENHR